MCARDRDEFADGALFRMDVVPATPGAPVRPAAPLEDGADVSWLTRVLPGDDQGQTRACAIFAVANWAEIVHGYDISDADCIALWRDTCRALGRPDCGLTYPQAFAACHAAGWLPGARAIRPSLTAEPLHRQPVLATYAMSAAWDRISDQGCLDHRAPRAVRGFHAAVLVAKGMLGDTGPWYYSENSHGARRGWRGVIVMRQDLFEWSCRELWTIETSAKGEAA